MSSSQLEFHPGTASAGSDDEMLIKRVLASPEPEALRCYAGLSMAAKWRARNQATGQRRAALVEYHVLEFATLR
jgi:hypothetical protein